MERSENGNCDVVAMWWIEAGNGGVAIKARLVDFRDGGRWMFRVRGIHRRSSFSVRRDERASSYSRRTMWCNARFSLQNVKLLAEREREREGGRVRRRDGGMQGRDEGKVSK